MWSSTIKMYIDYSSLYMNTTEESEETHFIQHLVCVSITMR